MQAFFKNKTKQKTHCIEEHIKTFTPYDKVDFLRMGQCTQIDRCSVTHYGYKDMITSCP